jgi:hypothetical protein
MKKLITTLAFAALFAITASAQIAIGLKGGLNLANITGEDVEENSMLTAFHGGVYATFNFGDRLGFQPELLLNGTGTTYDFGADGKLDFKTTYISVPMMLLFKINETFNIQAGPQLSFLTKAEISDGTTSIDFKDEVESTEWGANIGLGLNFGKFNVTGRYCIGLSNIAKESDVDVKNSVIQLSLGYTLFGGR